MLSQGNVQVGARKVNTQAPGTSKIKSNAVQHMGSQQSFLSEQLTQLSINNTNGNANKHIIKKGAYCEKCERYFTS